MYTEIVSLNFKLYLESKCTIHAWLCSWPAEKSQWTARQMNCNSNDDRLSAADGAATHSAGCRLLSKRKRHTHTPTHTHSEGWRKPINTLVADYWRPTSRHWPTRRSSSSTSLIVCCLWSSAIRVNFDLFPVKVYLALLWLKVVHKMLLLLD